MYCVHEFDTENKRIVGVRTYTKVRMFATALAQVNDPNRVSEWGKCLATKCPEFAAQLKIDTNILMRRDEEGQGYSDDITITLLMAGYAVHMNPLTLNEAPFEIYVALCDNIQDLFERLILVLIKRRQFTHILILLRYGAVPSYIHLYGICRVMHYSKDRQGLLNQLNTYDYTVDVELMNLNLATFSLSSAYHSSFYEIIAIAPLIALRYIHTPGLDLFGVGKTSLLHMCIKGVGTEDYDEPSKKAWVSLFQIIMQLEPRTLWATDGIGNSAERTLETEIYHAPDNVYFKQMQAYLVHD